VSELGDLGVFFFKFWLGLAWLGHFLNFRLHLLNFQAIIQLQNVQFFQILTSI